MLESKHLSRAAKSSLHFIGNQERSVFAAKLLRANKEIGLRSLTAFSLNGFNHESRYIARTQFAIERLEVIKRHTGIKAFH